MCVCACVCVLCEGVSRGGECLILYVPYVGDGELSINTFSSIMGCHTVQPLALWLECLQMLPSDDP